MRLSHLLEDVPLLRVTGDPSVEVTDVTHDSRQARPGSLFCCLRGRRVDGHDLAPDAERAGAVAVVCERPVDVTVTQVEVGDTHTAIGPIAAAFHGHPSRSMTMVGVTGTNGKTTTTHMIAAVLEAAGRRTALVGNLTALPGGPPNTPEAPVLQARLARHRDERFDAVAMEVSSIGLASHRVDGTEFDVAVFTNLTRDHLDDHGTMENYFEAKASLFTPRFTSLGIVNADDEWGRRLLERAEIELRPFSLDDVEATGSSFVWRGQRIEVALGGRYNVSNAVATAMVADALDVETNALIAGLKKVRVPGRFEVVPVDRPFTVVVDFAHTPDGLANLLGAAREVAADSDGRVIVVFGAGGDRDPTKRAPMGQIAARLADVVVVTSDNPRSEDPESIIDAVVAGGRSDHRDANRRAAIAWALEQARAGDVVVIAGKGHETEQELAGGQKIPFDDRAVVRELLASATESGDAV